MARSKLRNLAPDSLEVSVFFPLLTLLAFARIRAPPLPAPASLPPLSSFEVSLISLIEPVQLLDGRVVASSSSFLRNWNEKLVFVRAHCSVLYFLQVSLLREKVHVLSSLSVHSCSEASVLDWSVEVENFVLNVLLLSEILVVLIELSLSILDHVELEVFESLLELDESFFVEAVVEVGSLLAIPPRFLPGCQEVKVNDFRQLELFSRDEGLQLGLLLLFARLWIQHIPVLLALCTVIKVLTFGDLVPV